VTPTWRCCAPTPDYKAVFVGDASMSPYEIAMPGGSVEHWNEEPGHVWMERSFAQSQLRTRLRLENGPTITLSSVSFRSVVFADRQDAEYGAFLRNLAPAIAKANPAARFAAGRPYPLWLAMSGSAALLMGAIVLFIVYALSAGETTAAALGAFVAGLGIWQLEPLIRLNRPMPFTPDDPPASLVPPPPAGLPAAASEG
jgi:hypothetical protein